MQEDQPFYSVVIPTYNRPTELLRCLESLTRVNYPPQRFEVVVVDDGSENQPQESELHRVGNSLNLIFVRQENGGAAAARDAGATRASGKYLVFTDDDCSPGADWLSALSRAFELHPDAMVGGRVLNALPGNPCAAASQLLLDYLYEYFNPDQDAATFFASMNIALPRTGFLELGGFDARFRGAGGEDRDFCDRWLQAGKRMVYAKDAIIHHAHKLDFRSFCRQHLNYGRGAFKYHDRRSITLGEPLRLESPAFYLGLLRYPFRYAHTSRSFLLLGLLVVSQIVNALGYFLERYRK